MGSWFCKKKKVGEIKRRSENLDLNIGGEGGVGGEF